MATELERLVVRLVGDTTRFIPALRLATSEFADNTKKMEAMARRVELAVAGMTAIIAGSAVKAFAKFDKAMTESLAIMENVTSEMRTQMEDLAIVLSTTQKQSAAQLAEAYFFLASAGFSAKQSMDSLAVVQTFATAGNFNLAKATRLAAGAQNTLGLSSQNSAEHIRNLTRVTDVLVKANRLSQASTEQFAEALTNRAGPTLRIYNKSIEEGVAALAVYAKQNIVGMEAGTFLRRTLLLLAQSAIKAKDAHRAYGFSVFDAAGKMRNLSDIAQQLERILGPMTEKQRVATLAALGFQFRIQQAILPLVGMSKELRKFEKELKNAGGTSKQVAENQMQAFFNKMIRVKNQIVIVAFEIARQLIPHIEAFATTVKDSIPEVIGAFKATVGVLKEIGTFIGVILTPFKFLMEVIFGGNISTVRLFTAALTALVTVWITYRAVMLSVTALQALWLALSTGGISGVALVTATVIGVTAAIEGYKRSLKETLKVEEKLKDKRKEAAKIVQLQGKSLKDLNKELQIQQKLQKFFGSKLDSLMDQQRTQRRTTRGIPIPGGVSDASIKDTSDAFHLAVKRVEALKKAIADLGKEEKKRAVQQQQVKKRFGGAGVFSSLAEGDKFVRGIQSKFINPIRKFNEELTKLNAVRGELPPDVYRRALQKLKDDLDLATGGVKKFIEELERKVSVATIGESATILKEMAKIASPQQLARIKQLQDRIKRIELNKDLKRQAKSLVSSTRTELQRLQDQWSQMQKLFKQGFLNPGEFAQIKQFLTGQFRDLMQRQVDEAERGRKRLEQALRPRDAVAANSLEALQRLADFRNTIPDPTLTARDRTRIAQQQRRSGLRRRDPVTGRVGPARRFPAGDAFNDAARAENQGDVLAKLPLPQLVNALIELRKVEEKRLAQQPEGALDIFPAKLRGLIDPSDKAPF